jgi:hypothetical protein
MNTTLSGNLFLHGGWESAFGQLFCIRCALERDDPGYGKPKSYLVLRNNS